MATTIWQLDNFALGMHTEPGKQRGGSRYAADINNLEVDGDGWLRLRPNFLKVGTGGENITGLDASNEYLFILRDDGNLYIRSLDDLETETEIPGVSDLSGRISVISDYRDYIVLTSEGSDQGFWVDLREGETLQAHPLGIDKPISEDWTATKYPSDQLVDDTDDDDLVLRGPSIFVAYAISYVRTFEQIVGERDTTELFNNMESDLSDPVGFIFKRLDFKNDDHGPSTASTYQMASFDFSPLYTEATVLPLSLGRAYKTSGGTENTTNLREESPGGLRIGYLENEEGELITALTDLEDTEKIVVRPASGDDVVITLSADNAVVDNPATPDAGGFLSIAMANYTITGTFVADTVYNLYPANADGTIKETEIQITSNLPEQITGINIYRSFAIRENVDAASFDRITDLLLNNQDDLDLSELVYRKIAYIPKDDLNMSFADGIFAVKGDNQDQIINSGDVDGSSEYDEITGYRPYYHTIDFELANFTGVIAHLPPELGIKIDYAWYVDVLTALGLEGISVNVYGEGFPIQGIVADSTSLLPILTREENAVYFYKWSDQVYLRAGENKRIPSEVKQFYLHDDRIWGAAGNRLVYSNFDFGDLKLWAFPTRNAVRRSRPGRIDFVAEHREVLLFGGRDGLYRLTGVDPSNFNSDEISRTGPIDGYSWNATINALGYIGENGFYLTDAAQTQYVSKIALDKFFENKRARRGTMLFFSDDTFLFNVGLQLAQEIAFTWLDEDPIDLDIGNIKTDSIAWRQGDPTIEGFGLDDIDILFYSDANAQHQITSDDDNYNIGDQTLAEIITLTNFVDNDNGRGTFDINIDASGITQNELSMLRRVYIRLRVNQNRHPIVDHLFRYEDGYWTRWTDAEIKQVATAGIDWTRYWLTDGTGELVELEWNEENDDTELEWWWQSNWISGRAAGVQNQSKLFSTFCLSAASGTEMKLETWVDNDEEPVEVEFTSRDDLYFQKIPIQRNGERLRFRLSGTGAPRIRGIQIET